ncbi:signal transduction histidine kinase [Labedella gwakjiensis]|uniref:histidine kinase n=1 Tax=Labedella gwakjiensis TaxID=390269 RepID=A0A2P8H087_9MICO|nr:sensor histidine kinase [Labedella gwakjiensis]PSL39623.1 signal transduction histidine kinase [Labedella gwakjiensis]RUQ85987.1 sensor histidine kinase [Labedella gwakjiensis]
MIRVLTRTQKVVDVVVAAGIGLILLPFVFFSPDPVIAGFVVLFLASALAVRRYSPVIALSAAWFAVAVQLTTQQPANVFDVMILPVLYAVGRYGEGWVRWYGLVSAIVGGVIASVYTVSQVYGVGVPIYDSTGWTVTIFSVVTASAAAVFVLTIAWGLGVIIRQAETTRASRAEQYRLEQERLSAERTVVVEQERNRIARDMHDVVAHSLAVVIAQADGARYAMVTAPQMGERALETISETAREALIDVRVLLAELRHSQSGGPQPMIGDLGRLVDQMRAAGLGIRFVESGVARPMPASHQIAVYRIVQESLTNALRHGDKTRDVAVTVRWVEQGVAVSVENAVPPVPTAPSPGHGIAGMRERAELTGGRLTIDRPGGMAFRVDAFIPFPAPLREAP